MFANWYAALNLFSLSTFLPVSVGVTLFRCVYLMCLSHLSISSHVSISRVYLMPHIHLTWVILLICNGHVRGRSKTNKLNNLFGMWIYFRKRVQNLRIRAQHLREWVLYLRKKSYFSGKESYISGKESYISTKESYISAKEPYISAKEPYISSKLRPISPKKSPIPPQKSPRHLQKSPIYRAVKKWGGEGGFLYL